MGKEWLVVKSRPSQKPIRRPASDVKGRRLDAKLNSDAAARDPLVALRAEFDCELAILRQTKTPGRLREAFASPPAEIARAANAPNRRKR